MIVETIEAVITAVKNGEVVAFPTDTVYGLGCDAQNLQALKRIYELKQRPDEKPLILFVANQEKVHAFVNEVPTVAKQLMDCFWPGPLTIVLPKNATVSEEITSGLATVGLRMPNHPQVLQLLEQSQITLATTSANLSGEEAANNAQTVEQVFGDRVVSLAGVAQRQIPSTVIEVTPQNTYRILREGAISTQEIAACLESTSSKANK